MGVSVIRKTLTVPEMKRRLYQKAKPYGAVPAIPVAIAMEHPNTRMRVKRSGDMFVQNWGEGIVSEAPGRVLNGPEVLEIFASIRTPDELVPFLEFCGPFRDRGLGEQKITWAEFQQWQRFIYSLRRMEPLVFPHLDKWEYIEAITDPQPDMPHLVAGRRQRVMIFHPKTALELIGTVAYIDYLRAVDLHICALSTCRKLFERTSDHGQKCCCKAHLRQQAKRLSREAARKAEKQEKV